jgi:hypothetical protein
MIRLNLTVYRAESQSLHRWLAMFFSLLPPPRSTIAIAFSLDGKHLHPQDHFIQTELKDIYFFQLSASSNCIERHQTELKDNKHAR